jgi:hypothetical protein
VLGGIAEGLLHNAVENDFKRLRDLSFADLEAGRDADSLVEARKIAAKPLGRGQQPQVVQGRRAQVGRYALGFLDGLPDVGDDALEGDFRRRQAVAVNLQSPLQGELDGR